MTIILPTELEERLTALAGMTKRNPQAVLAEAVNAYVDEETAFLEAIQEGKDAAARGEGTPHDEVFARLEKKLLDKYGIRV